MGARNDPEIQQLQAEQNRIIQGLATTNHKEQIVDSYDPPDHRDD